MRRLKKTPIDLDAAEAREAGLTYGQWRAQQWDAAGRPEIRGTAASSPEAAQPRQRRNRKAPNFSTEEFCLLYNAGYSDSEIAKRLGVTYNTVVHRRNMQLNAPPNRRKPGEPLVPPKERISEERFERPWNR